MYYFLSMLSGILIAFMILMNGELTAHNGVYTATVMIHIIGLLFILFLMLVKRKELLPGKKLPWFYYLGGVIGVCNTVFNNLAFGIISVSAILALGLLGQSIASIIIDEFGLFHMAKRRFDRRKLVGLALVLSGVLYITELSSFDTLALQVGIPLLLAVIVSFASGITTVLSRTVNSLLAHSTNVWKSTLYNYVTGLFVAVIVLFLLGRQEPDPLTAGLSPDLWIYLGGILGVFVVFLANAIVSKISSFYMTLLLFIGQVFTGLILDAFLSQSFSLERLIGGILVAAGLSFNLWMDKLSSR